jgi:hypothetical protein
MCKQLEWRYSHGEIKLPDIKKVEEQLGISFPKKHVEIMLKYQSDSGIPPCDLFAR